MLPTLNADEQSLNRLTSRRTRWWIHLLVTVIAVFTILSGLTDYNASYHSWLSTNSPWLLSALVILIAVHTVYLAFREAYERGFRQGQYALLLEREWEHKRKRPYTDPSLVYLSDDGELVDYDYDEDADDDFDPPRRKRG
jgi:hypothetical protein